MSPLMYVVIAVTVVILFSIIKNQSGKKDIPKFLQDGAIVIDVRSKQEFQSGHFSTAKNIPHDQIKNKIQEVGKDKTKPIIVYCASGARSTVARSTLMEMGYTNVLNAGGYSSIRQFDTKQ